MNNDKHLIVFYRKTIHDDLYSNNNSDSVVTMATDYFDIVDIKNYTEVDSLTKLIDEDVSYKYSEQEVVSVQSYPIYCDIKKLEQYNVKPENDDPLHTNDLPFMSIIQVHITPEVIVRLKDFNMQNDEKNALDMFRDDLYNLLNSFVENNKECNIRYRVYNALSAGDFTIITKSDKADISFRISMLLRKRVAKTDKICDDKIVLYKTYTILTFDSSIIDTDKSEQGSKDNIFVIRCCFSNKYWAERSKIDEKLHAYISTISNDIYRLNGRYDFSLELSDEEFKQIYPLIAKSKGCSVSNELIKTIAEKDSIKKDSSTKVNYLAFLLKNGYLSYVNERYLFLFDETSDNETISSESHNIKILFKEKIFLSDYNKARYKKLIEKCSIISENMIKFTGCRKNTIYYISLLKKLIELCQAINGLSDTRIYASILMKQLEIVIESVNSYQEKLHATKDITILDDIDVHLRESVIALDAYAKYIRNNNLQTLQTPNYNLESNISMEKCLISYSQFLEDLIRWYNHQKTKKHIGEVTQEFLPVMLPDLSNNNLSIEVIFPPILECSKDEKAKRLMIVKCPTLRDLANMPEMIAMLFHEVAHQFRYEKRTKRNEMLLQYCISAAFEPFIQRIKADLTHNIPSAVEVDEFLHYIFTSIVKEQYIETIYKDDKDIYNYQLFAFKEKLLSDFNAMWEKYNFEEKLLEYRDNLLNDIKYKIDVNRDGEYLQHISDFYDSMESGFVDENDIQEKLENFITALKNLFENNKNSAAINALLYFIDAQSEKYIKKCLIHKSSFKMFFDKVYKKLCKKISVELETSNHDSAPKYRYISRYLGIDYNTDDNMREFNKLMIRNFNFAFNDVLERIFSVIEEYREQTSDMFMCNLLSLTPFGYLNIMAYALPIDIKMLDVYCKRMAYVLRFTYDYSDKMEMFGEILSNIYININSLLSHHSNGFDDSQLALFNNIQTEANVIVNECNYNEVIKNIYIVKNLCLDLKEALIDKDTIKFSTCISNLEHYSIMLTMLSNLIISYDDFLNDLKFNIELKKDLQYGVEILKELHSDLKLENIWKYCECAKVLINNPCLKYMDYSPQNVQINDTILHFIEDMYYTNKFKNAKEALTEEDSNGC